MHSPALRVAAPLADGRVLVLGGKDQDAEVFDPKTDSFSHAGSMTVERNSMGDDWATAWQGLTATALPDGRVLIVGGATADGTPLDSAEVFR